MNRAERRRKNRELIKSNDIKVVNAREMAANMAASGIAMIHYAIALSLMLDFGKLQKKDTRLKTVLDVMEKYNEKLTEKTLTDEEKAICEEFDGLLVKWLEGVKKK